MSKRTFVLGALVGAGLTIAIARRFLRGFDVVLDDLLTDDDIAIAPAAPIRFGVTITAIGDRKAALTRAVRALAGAEGPNAATIAASLPYRLLESASADEARAAAAALERAGATVVID